MATYQVWLTVKDSYGNLKEVSGGTINVDLSADLSKMTAEEASQVAKKLDPYFTTSAEVERAVEHSDLIKYSDLDLRPTE